MRRVAMVLGTVGLMALGIAATPAPAQAYDAGWGYPASREQAWRQHEWRQHQAGNLGPTTRVIMRRAVIMPRTRPSDSISADRRK